MKIQKKCLFFRAFVVLCFTLLFCSTYAVAKSVYDGQPPMDDKELVRFIEILPQFRAWAVAQKVEAHPSTTDGKADFVYSDSAAQWVSAHGWEPARFFSVMGRTAAALSMVADGADVNAPHPPDMPSVTQAELDLVHKHLSTLLQAGNSARSISQ